ncbi:YicC/YloC family endoribonuclease [Hyphococcus sp.]|uniref:YicC/YloC family endoribonuclease n=1 Tax=Hyphococcus sp. TaxID=2038636 RepID=UPI003CCC0299
MTGQLSSMTGFARADGAHDAWRWVWELRTVNSRGLEWRVRIPAGYESLDPGLRKAAKGKLSRGAFNATLSIHSEKSEAQYAVNEKMLRQAISMIEHIQAHMKCAPPQPEGVLAIKGVVELAEHDEDEADREALHAALLSSFERALDKLIDARRAEGGGLAATLTAQIDEIESLTAAAAAHAASAPAALKARLETQLKELLADSAVPQDRLAQEAALLAVKADVREELDRLKTHVSAARSLLNKAGPAGRELDFLTQEFNREANTLCSKASDMDLKRIGLDLKGVIDQMREQVQNVE